MRDELLNFSAFVLAVVFGIGLSISGMLNPANVIGFLDIFGNWKPALALVMASGIGVALPFFIVSKNRKAPILDKAFHNPPQKFDTRIIVGSAIFGIGWGLVGICPGPALVLTLANPAAILPFIIPMFAGFFIGEALIARALPRLVAAE